MRKKLAVICLLFLVITVFMGCDQKSNTAQGADDSKEPSELSRLPSMPSDTESVVSDEPSQSSAPVQEEGFLFELPEKADVLLTKFELIPGDDGATYIVFFANVYGRSPEGSICLNELVSEKGALHFYQNGRRLEPRYTDQTENITFKVGNGQMIRAAKGFELISTTDTVDAVLYGDDGTVIQSYTISLS